MDRVLAGLCRIQGDSAQNPAHSCLRSSRRDRLPTPLTTGWYKMPLDENQEARTSGRHNAF